MSHDQARIRTSRLRPVPAGGADCPEELRTVRYLRYFVLGFFGFIHHPEGWRLARKWDAEAAEPRKRRVSALDQLAHEVNKVRQGGYWREVEWDRIAAVSLDGGYSFFHGRPITFRWTPR